MQNEWYSSEMTDKRRYPQSLFTISLTQFSHILWKLVWNRRQVHWATKHILSPLSVILCYAQLWRQWANQTNEPHEYIIELFNWKNILLIKADCTCCSFSLIQGGWSERVKSSPWRKWRLLAIGMSSHSRIWKMNFKCQTDHHVK